MTRCSFAGAWKHTREAINNPKNRRAGLQAIHDNFTLSAQAVGWAAMQGDPIAEQILRTCGVNAQTLADSDTDAKAVVSYLETLLYEDRQVKGHGKNQHQVGSRPSSNLPPAHGSLPNTAARPKPYPS